MTSSGPGPKLGVEQPNDCERILVEEPIPGLKDAKGRPLTHRVVMRRTQAALALANGKIVEGRECMADQRSAYQNVK